MYFLNNSYMLIVGLVVIVFTVMVAICASGEFAPVIVALFLLGAILTALGHKGMPTAMDVYKGRTTLEITWKDSVAIDSIVVYK